MPPMGIIFEYEASPLVSELAEALYELGLTREQSAENVLTPGLLDALNDYRSANLMAELDFCDPAALRSLGIHCTGDDVMLLARYGESVSTTEIGCYDACRKAAAEANRMGVSICTYVSSRADLGHLPLTVSSGSVSAALLAVLS